MKPMHAWLDHIHMLVSISPKLSVFRGVFEKEKLTYDVIRKPID